MLTFYDNGEYTVYSECDVEGDEELEIGTYTLTGTSLSIDSHIQNGCGGFDEENNPGVPPSSPLEISFNQDGSSLTFVSLGNITVTRVQ